jgi:hypothetical protein
MDKQNVKLYKQVPMFESKRKKEKKKKEKEKEKGKGKN